MDLVIVVGSRGDATFTPVNAGVAAIPAERAGIEAKTVAVVDLFLRFYAARPFALS
jgi:hypothetical protein